MMFVMLAPVLMVVLAGAISLAALMADRSTLQDQLDSAVLAGAASSGDENAQITAANKYFNGNGQNSALMNGTSASFAVRDDIVYGVADTKGPGLLEGMLHKNTFNVHVTAAARRTSIPVCILGLNALDSGAFDVNGNPALNAPNCAVQANSGSDRAMTQEGSAPEHAAKFGVTGMADVNDFFPSPADASPAISDPLAQMPFPPYDSCTGNEKALSISQSTILSPGTFCGGIVITGSGTEVTFQPGIYVMVNGPLQIKGNASATGDQLMVAFTGAGATLQLWGDSSLTLTSPSTGAYANIQFFQNGNDANGRGARVSIGGSASDGSHLKYDGVAYFPTQNFWAYGNVTIDANSPGLAIDAGKVWLQGNATVSITNSNPRNVAANGSVQTNIGAQLIN